MADWYYAKNGQQQGPVSSAQLKQMASSGQIGPTDLVFQEGGTQWVEASTVKGLQFGGGAAPAPAPAPVQPSRSAPPPRDRDDRDDRDRDRDRGRSKRRDDDDGEFPTDDFDRPRRRSDEGGIGDFFLVRAFIAPYMMPIIFWFGILGILWQMGRMWLDIASAVFQFPSAFGFGVFIGYTLSIPAAMIFWRMVCEGVMVAFRIFETLKDILKEQKKANSK